MGNTTNSFKVALIISLVPYQSLMGQGLTVVWRDDFIDDADGFLPQIRPADPGIPGDTEDFGIDWTDLGADNLAIADGGFLSLDGASSSGMDSGIRGSFQTVGINDRFDLSIDIALGSGKVGTHMAIGSSLGEDVDNDLITGTGFFGVRFIKGGSIEKWDGNITGWTSVGTVADFAGQTVQISMNETDFDLSVSGSLFTGLSYASARTSLSSMEIAFAGNNGSRSLTGLISGENLSAVPEPSALGMIALGGLGFIIRRRRF